MRKIGQFIDSGLLKIFDIDQMHKNSLFCPYWTLSHFIDKNEIFLEKQSRKTALIRKGLRHVVGEAGTYAGQGRKTALIRKGLRR